MPSGAKLACTLNSLWTLVEFDALPFVADFFGSDLMIFLIWVLLFSSFFFLYLGMVVTGVRFVCPTGQFCLGSTLPFFGNDALVFFVFSFYNFS